MIYNLENIKKMLKKVALGKLKKGLKFIGYGIAAFGIAIIFWILYYTIGITIKQRIFMNFAPIAGVVFIVIGIFNILFFNSIKLKFKREFNKKIREYNISSKTLQEIDSEFGKAKEEVVVACGYLINIKGKIIKLDEIDYINLKVNIKENTEKNAKENHELKIDVYLKNGKIGDSILMEVAIDLARDVIMGRNDIDFGNGFLGKLQEANVEFRFTN